MNHTPRIPRHRAPIIRRHNRLRWIDLQPLTRIAFGLAIGLLAIAVLGAAL